MQNLCLENLKDYDQGALALLVDQGFRQIYLDLEDRPMLKTARSLTLKFDFVPVADTDGSHAQLDTITTNVSVKTGLPNKATRTNYLAPNRKAGAIGFEADTARAKYDPDQRTLPLDD